MVPFVTPDKKTKIAQQKLFYQSTGEENVDFSFHELCRLHIMYQMGVPLLIKRGPT
jgi:hypothetical protein